MYSPIDIMSCFLSKKGVCLWVVIDLINLHRIGGISTVPRAAVKGPVQWSAQIERICEVSLLKFLQILETLDPSRKKRHLLL